MSASSSNTKYGNRYSVARTNKGGGKFCKICKDTGKSISEYTSHYVRESPDPKSKVVCPTLLAAVCRYCKNGGHTVKHCPKIQAKNRQEHKKDDHIISRNYCKETTDSKKVKETDNFRSAFSVLDYDDNDGEETESSTTLITTPPSSDIKKPDVISYASILKNPPPTHAPPSPPSKNDENLAVSQVDSLIPTKLDFSQEEVNSENVVTLFDVTGKWSDEEIIEDCNILEIYSPNLKYDDHPLYHYTRWLNVNVISRFTEDYTKNTRVTEDAFYELFERWDKEYFDNNKGLNITMNLEPATDKNGRRMSIIMKFTR
jgi:hypothetical protein